ncbi:MAG TPA: S41 family peptidase [Terracidiphilus sp.]|jgi:hypothetical protein
MSDPILACLLRLYPSRFREKYRDEALQLYRDRLRDETGVLRRVRLLCDLLLDAASGLPRAWRNSYSVETAPTFVPNSHGVPLFRILEREPLRPGAIFVGSTLSFAALFAFGAIMSLPSAFHVASKLGKPASAIESVLERVNRAASQDNGARAAAAIGSPAAVSSMQSSPHDPSTLSIASAANLDAAERNRVIQSVADNLATHYYDRDRARQASTELLSLQQHGYYNAIVDGQALATRLTFALQRSTGDRHIKIEFSRNIIPDGPPRPSAVALDQYQSAMKQETCTFEKVELLPGNIGYVKLNSFPDPAVCAATAQSAIARLSHSDAIIFDLRDNTGGFPEMVSMMAEPLFDHPVRWYNPRQGDGSTWLSPARGSSLADKPVYILTSGITLSGAEHFTYNLKMLKRATVVGDTTGGGAHVGTFHRIDDHFGMGIPETPINNPYGEPDWEGTGVEPDIKVAPANALATAEKLARERLAR